MGKQEIIFEIDFDKLLHPTSDELMVILEEHEWSADIWIHIRALSRFDQRLADISLWLLMAENDGKLYSLIAW